MLITWMRGFRENSDGLVFVEAAETTQQGRQNPGIGCWPAEEGIRNVLLPLGQHIGTPMHRGGSLRFERGR